MGRISLNDLENYKSGNGGKYFKLTNDKEVARVRFLLDKPEDIEDFIYAVHEVDIDGTKKYVSCLREYNEPIDKCPFCAAQMKVVPKIFVPLYNEDADASQIWERGKKFMPTLSSFMSRYSKPSIVSHLVEIERNGKPKDTSTTYALYEVDKDDTILDDLPEAREILGDFVLEKSEDDMNYYLEAKEFPPEDDEQPVRRRASRKDDEVDEEEPPFEEDEAEEEEEKPQRRSSRRGDNAGSSRRTPTRSRRSF